ncbi:hypothetical protein FHQ28_03570 [Pasteurellaceae bacterium USgator11]|nr:hypothetical protein FHQ20_06010 [Pasteurellaceae bacterium USgator41]TNG97012.1 hypothetical protein FHQ19_00690 [Pasteurellaceae bacterium UScroc12]TNH00833.1 hypothetical protein FHQ24_02490 [Pasteurellaceae bacterium UScroc31]TNH02400.1 hypothetical protein FHQ28_03570 [Pasteurellaceae bacterium USgator11]
MKKLTATLLTLSCLPASSWAAVWNQTTLDQAAEQTITQLDLFLDENPKSLLYSEFSQEQLQQLRAAADTNNSAQNLNFQNLKNKNQLVSTLYNIADKNFYGDRLVPYLYLYNQYFPSAENQYKLYSMITDYDQRNIEFTFPAFQRYVSQHANVGDVQQYWQHFVDSYGFKLNKANVQNNLDIPLVCLNFSQIVNPEPLQNWKQFLHVRPNNNVQWQYQGENICFQGEWQTEYALQIDPKLQSEYRLGLTNPTEQDRLIHLNVTTGNRTPMLRFANKGKVLNAYTERNLNLESANVDKIHLQLWQIPANNLANYPVRDLIASNAYWWRIESTLNDNARLLFEGYFEPENKQQNQTNTSNIFFDDLVKEMKPGMYMLKASVDNNNDENADFITFTLSNNGFTAYKTSQGLWVEVRDLESKKPVAGQAVSLYAKDNDILATVKTDRNGIAFFEQAHISGERGATPSHIISLEQNRMGYLDLLSDSIDLSDKGLSGELASPLMQSWVWFDRGVYRPNDTANAMFLFKTPDGKPFSGTSIWATLVRPDGKIFSVNELKPHNNGAYYFSHYFPSIARLGNWKLQLSLANDGKGYLTEHNINLAAILPQQISVKTSSQTPVLRSGETALFDIKADWLYGSPASELSSNVNWLIQSSDESNPQWQAWKNWQIGVFDEQSKASSQQNTLPATDKQGVSQFALPLTNLPHSSKPLQLKLQSAVTEPSGQEVIDTLTVNIQRNEPYLALTVQDKTAQAALIDEQGQVLSGKLDWKLYQVNYSWYWYRNDSGWDYKVNESRYLTAQGSINAEAKQPSSISLPINDGSWVLEVQGASPLTAASVPIEYGNWSQPNINNAPDTISISSDKERYQDGERVKVRLRAPFDGPASVKLATREIVDNYQVNFSNGEAKLDFKWQDEWAQGLWLLANGWNQAPNDKQNLRAVGLHWLGSDLQQVNLNLQIDSPAETLPNQKISLPLQLDKPSKNTWLQVAVVDEGLYQLAKASFNNPQEAFWGKKQINLEMFDVWGSLIKQLKARQAAIRSGAGTDDSLELGTVALPDLDIDLLTYWSNPILLDDQGKAQVELELPQFNGKVRIMAVAWNPQQIGTAEKTMLVKEPLVTQLNTPLFLSAGDQTEMKVRLHNTTDKIMQLNVEMSANAPVKFEDNKQTQVIKLQPQQALTLNRTFKVEQPGKAEFKLQISGDIQKQWQRFADIRKPALPFNQISLNQLAAGSTWQSPALAQGGTVTNNLVLSNRAPFDPQDVISYLNTYPYGCVEQTASASWNNLLLNQLIPGYQLPSADYPDQAQRQNNLNNAILRLANQQAYDGGFSLWGGDQSDVWLSAFVGEFLLDNKLQNPLFQQHSTLNRTLAYLYQAVNNADYARLQPTIADTSGYAYALYVLAKAGEPVQGALLKALPVVAKQSEIYPARLFILNALLLQGEVGKVAEQMALIAKAPQAISFGYANYGAQLRDYASEMVLLYELKNQVEKLKIAEAKLVENIDSAINVVWGALLNELKSTDYFSTQSAHWLARLATLLPQSSAELELEVNGNKLQVNGLESLSLNNQAVQVRNLGTNPAFISLNQWITPTVAEQIENGYQIEITFRDLQGRALDPAALSLNELVVIEFELSKTETAPQTNADMMLVYSLPAGFSIQENMSLPIFEQDDSSLQAEFSENRDDRHLVAFNFAQNQTSATHRIVVRAAKSGDWTAPATTLENMYQPQYRAVLPSAEIRIK